MSGASRASSGIRSSGRLPRPWRPSVTALIPWSSECAPRSHWRTRRRLLSASGTVGSCGRSRAG
eukprot:8343488-Lingulodinium_polyedra.AAC.1